MVLLEFLAVLLVVGVIALIVWAFVRFDKSRKRVVELRNQLSHVERGVREIANVSSDPDTRLQASILLDEIANTYYSKELS